MGDAEENVTEINIRAWQWSAQAETIICADGYPENEGRFLRVATPLLNAEPEVYIPQYLSLSPYYHFKLQKQISAKVDNYEVYKVQSAATFWRKESRLWDFDHIVGKIREKMHEIEEFYNWNFEFEMDKWRWYKGIRCGEMTYEAWAVMMTVDLSFLLFFLYRELDCEYGELMRRSTRLNDVSIECDILKLENQIPLSVLEILWKETFCFHRDKLRLDEMLLRTCNRLSPFTLDSVRRESEVEINKQPHLLGYLHKFVSPTLDMEAVIDHERGPTLWESAQHTLEMVVAAVFTLLHVRPPTNIPNSYNAQVLEKAGIKFKLFYRKPDGIRFNIYSATLYLPQINIVSEVQTEVLFKNMLALEFNDAARAFSVTRYVWLMSHLIGTPEDVRVLTKSQVIHRRSLALTDEKIARMWNGMCHPIFTCHVEPPKDLESALLEVVIRKYYWGILKWVLWGFYWVPIKERLSKPGKGIALLVGILILVISLLSKDILMRCTTVRPTNLLLLEKKLLNRARLCCSTSDCELYFNVIIE